MKFISSQLSIIDYFPAENGWPNAGLLIAWLHSVISGPSAPYIIKQSIDLPYNAQSHSFNWLYLFFLCLLLSCLLALKCFCLSRSFLLSCFVSVSCALLFEVASLVFKHTDIHLWVCDLHLRLQASIIHDEQPPSLLQRSSFPALILSSLTHALLIFSRTIIFIIGSHIVMLMLSGIISIWFS